MEIIDFDYYTNEYGGTIITSEALFNELVKKEKKYLDVLTFYRLEDEEIIDVLSLADIKKINDCLCELVDLQKTYEDKTADIVVGIKSESVDGYNITYATQQEKKEMETKHDYDKQKLVRERLALTFLLFRG